MAGLRLRAASLSIVLAASVAAALAEQPILVYRPAHEELKYTFGGAAPIRRIKPGTRIVSWTEDCYDGAVTRPGQLPSKVQLPGHDNPQTGPSSSKERSRATRSSSGSKSSSRPATTGSPPRFPASAP